MSVTMILLSMAISSSNQFSKEAKTRFGICFVAIVVLLSYSSDPLSSSIRNVVVFIFKFEFSCHFVVVLLLFCIHTTGTCT